MKKKTKIIIIAVVAVALFALAVWYFGFHKKKAKETDEEGENKTPVNPTGWLCGPDLNIKDLFGRKNTIKEPEAIARTDYGVAPAAAYRLNHDQLTELDAQLGRTANAIANTNKINR